MSVSRVRRWLLTVAAMLGSGAFSSAGAVIDGPASGNAGKLEKNSGAADVVVSDWHILVDGTRFIIKGVCYNPVPVGGTSWSWSTLDEDIVLMQQAGINTIRTYAPIEEAWVLDRFADAGIKIVMGITSGSGTYNIQNGGYLTYIDMFKEHEAILLWELGNEYNYHPEWFGGDVNNWYAMLEDAARQIHLIDPAHPVSTAHGEVPSHAVLESVPSIDVWGMNVYRWDQSHSAIIDFALRSDKPCYLSETGGDSYNADPEHPIYPFGVNEHMQADAVGVILDNLFFHLDVGSGVNLFEFSDEWWKAGDPWNQDPGGSAPNSSSVPYDGAANEEHWGIVDVYRAEKLSLDAVASAYTRDLCLLSAHAGRDQHLPFGANATTLDGSASSHSGPLTYQWSQISGPTTVTFSSTTAIQPQIAGLVEGSYRFNLTVSGDCGFSTDLVDVSVPDAVNITPTANAGPVQNLPIGTHSGALDGTGSVDPDGGPASLRYLWTQTAGPMVNLSGNWEASPLVSGMSDGESYTFELVVSDGLDSSLPSSVTISIDPMFVDGFESGDTTRWPFGGPVSTLLPTRRQMKVPSEPRPPSLEPRRQSTHGIIQRRTVRTDPVWIGTQTDAPDTRRS